MENNDKPLDEKKNGIKRYIPLIAIILVVLIAGILWYRQYSKYIYTDDAYIDSDNIFMSSKILGRIARLYYEEGDTVRKGKLLVELDSSDLVAQKKQSMAIRDQAFANQLQSQAKYQYDLENVKLQEINLQKAQDDYDRAKTQYSGEVITKEAFDHIQKSYESSETQLDAAKIQMNVSKAQINTSSAAVASANATIGVISTQINNTRIYSPVDGVIAKRWWLTGDIVQPGQAIYTINNNHKFWVLVYLEETKISDVHMGQKAKYTIDAFPGVTFIGKVISIGSNTASQFSLIPPSNASGNFTKVTQRIPVKISIDSTEDNGNISNYKILSGMSVVIKIIKE